jgi:hypothetical protein
LLMIVPLTLVDAKGPCAVDNRACDSAIHAWHRCGDSVFSGMTPLRIQ